VPAGAIRGDASHLTESLYRRYAIVDAAMLRQVAAELDALHATNFFARSRLVDPSGACYVCVRWWANRT
jgi:hypothetical protein